MIDFYFAARRSVRVCWGLLAFCILIATGCIGDPDRQKIVGDWEIAVASKLVEQVNSDASEATLSQEESPKMLVRFFNSGSLTTQTNMGTVRSEKQGSWKFISYDADTQIVQIECRLMDETTVFDVEFDDENTIRMVPPNMAGLTKKIKFVRQ